MKIRPTIPEDAPYLKSWLMDDKILRFFPMINEMEVDDAVRIWVGYGKLGAAITVLEDDKPVGMANLYIQPFKKLAHQCLLSIIIDEAYRGKGVGAFLMRHLIQLAKEQFHIEILHLEVYQGNPAINLYRRLGFKVYGKQDHFIKDHGGYIAKILMEKRL